MKPTLSNIPLTKQSVLLLSIFLLIAFASCKKEEDKKTEKLELVSCYIGEVQLQIAAEMTNVPLNRDVIITFSEAVDTVLAKTYISIKDEQNVLFGGLRFAFTDNNKTVILTHQQNFGKLKRYFLSVSLSLKGSKGQSFPGATFSFTTESGEFNLENISLDGVDFSGNGDFYNQKRQGLVLQLEFTESVDTLQIASRFTLSGSPVFKVSFADDYKKLILECTEELEGYKKFTFVASSGIRSVSGYSFAGFSNTFFTEVDSTLKFPLISDDELLTLVQRQTFKFFYDYAHPQSGMARERFGSGDIVTSGGSGFGVMALIVGMERGFITREEGVTRLAKIIHFLETCDRFHGAWSHWINGSTGKVVPFGQKDNGGDLVETAFMAQGLLAMRQYLDPENTTENDLIGRITELYNGIEWDWYTRGNQNVLFWHWSPNYGWDMNFRIQGYNETLITYILAAASPTYTIPASAYHIGYARNGAIINGRTFYGHVLPVGYDFGGPLFFAHYSFLGLDPRNLSDNYANYWTQNVNHSLINFAYCAANPKGYPNYSEHCWGLTASDIPSGYGVSEPTNDRGVISPTAAVSSLPYTPEQSMNAIRYFYYILGDKLWGDYGYYDAFDVHAGWWASSYIAIDQGPQIVMIENYRTGLIWNLFMSAPEVQTGLNKLGFTY
ncbi:MAG: glucoamylase family protein [Bacteroidales bacterium]|nr:glucoamylase family protein [Bacteroidales bacterium]